MSDSITFKDLVGEVHHDPEAIGAFLSWWFREGDLVNATFIREGKRKKVITHGAERDDLIEMLSQEDFKTGFLDKADFNSYFTTSASNKVYEQDDEHRPTKGDCAGLRGVWADVDCKPGVFGGEAELREWIESLAVTPGAIVWTGSGGAHLYWKVEGLETIPVADVGKRWWGYLNSTTPEGVLIDRLIDVETRILRIPGTTRFPKEKETIGIKPVTVEFTGADPIEADVFKKITDEGLKEYNNRTRKTREKLNELDTLTEAYLDGEDLGFWGRMTILGEIEEMTSDLITWDEILEGYGWEFYRNGSEGRREWARPGKFAKAGVTDWEESPDMLSLFSWSEETGLADLYEADAALTKWRVFLRLVHDDDLESAIADIVERASR